MAKYENLSADEIRGHRMLVFRRTVAYIVLKRYNDIKNDIQSASGR